MPTVRVEPSGVEIEVAPGEALAIAAWRRGYRWPTLCWGQAECMLCRVKVIAGVDSLEPPGRDEIEALHVNLRVSPERDRIRLACRMRVDAEGVVVEKKGVVPPNSDERQAKPGESGRVSDA